MGSIDDPTGFDPAADYAWGPSASPSNPEITGWNEDEDGWELVPVVPSGGYAGYSGFRGQCGGDLDNPIGCRWVWDGFWY